MRTSKWFDNHSLVLELFVTANLAFLAVDVFLAHSVNGFAHSGEWIPVLFSIIASLLMLLTLFIKRGGVSRLVGLGVGFTIGVGIGFYLHLSVDWQATEWIYGPPPFAPLLLTDLALLGLLGIFNLVRKGQTVTEPQ